MKEDVYHYHANQERNDFAQWIQDVYGAVDSADQLRNAKTPKEAANAIRTCLLSRGHSNVASSFRSRASPFRDVIRSLHFFVNPLFDTRMMV